MQCACGNPPRSVNQEAPMSLRFTPVLCAVVLALAACGGGDALDDTQESALGADPASADDGSQASDGRAQAASSTAAGTLELVSSDASGTARSGYIGALEAGSCGMSADGRLVLFNSDASNLVAGDSNARTDVFLKNLNTGAVTRVSTQSNGAQMAAGASCVALTPDGSRALLRAPTGGTLWVKNLGSGTLVQVTPAPDSIPQNTGFTGGAISDDANLVVFKTAPTTIFLGAFQFVNAVPRRLMLRDLRDNSLVTLPTDDGVVANGEVGIAPAALSPDGTLVAFASTSSSLVADDGNGQLDVFVRNLATGTATLVSRDGTGAPAAPTVSGFFQYYNVRFAADGLLQFYAAQPSTLGPRGEYATDLGTQQTSLLLSDSEGSSAQLFADGRRLAFLRNIPGSSNFRAFVRELGTGTEQVVNTTASGTIGNGNVNSVQVSRDGSSVAFGSNARNLIKPKPPAGSYQVYRKAVAASTGSL
jgi:Tol biopolymer transport system component